MLFGGTHTYRFSPSTQTPGATTFTNEEEFVRLSVAMLWFVDAEKIFMGFCERFKIRVEAGRDGGGLAE